MDHNTKQNYRSVDFLSENNIHISYLKNLSIYIKVFTPVFLFLVTVFFQVGGIEAGIQNSFLEDKPEDAWHIIGDSISFDDRNQQYVVKGNVHVKKGIKTLSADYVRFYQKTMDAFAKGNVIMTVGEDYIAGSRMEINLDSETGTIFDGTVFIKANHFYIRGDEIQKVGKDSYEVHKASISTCDGDNPAWKITGRNLKVTIEGYAFLSHAALWAKKVPVIYSPYFIFPVKLKRQTGMLPPEFGFSDRTWEEYIQPFYWAINDSSDATFYLHHMERRGEKIGFEYRYALSEKSKGTFMLDVLHDSKVDDGAIISNRDWGYHEENEILRPNKDRYWFRMKHNQGVPFGFNAKIDLDIVSDQDYLREFKDGLTGFYFTDDYFNQAFGRDLDDFDDQTRTNKLNINKSWSGYSLNADFLWYDNVVARRWNDTDTTLQKMPYVEFVGAKQQVFQTPFYFDLDSEYTYFYREDGIRGHRVDAYPRMYLPFNIGNYATIEPSVGFQETIWHFDRDKYLFSNMDTSDTKRYEDTMSRELYDFKVGVSSQVYRIYNGIGENDNSIKHSITPRVAYEYIPYNDNQGVKYPQFDSLDNINRKSLITYSLINTFTYRTPKSVKDTDAQDESELKPGQEESLESIEKPPVTYAYHQFCRFKLEQSYDINEAKEEIVSKRIGGANKRPVTPLKGELELDFGKYCNIKATAQRSPYESFYQSHNISMRISDKRRDRLFVEHRYKHNSSESIYTDLSFVVNDRVTVYADHERNLYAKKNIITSAGVIYKSQCWSIDLNFVDEENDRKYGFVISLYGLGKFQKSIKGKVFEDPTL
ncbi:MAG: LPS-assembly protein LptD [Desulfobacterales bacterium]|jgi:LPS-assembly protein|nr:LPS-assembly protein LptD [Desulfobacterales bacterium]MBT7697487.1 LPS-assembly protein LptD [Desulfobacterales bacterium]